MRTRHATMRDRVAINISGAAAFMQSMSFAEKVAFATTCGVNAIELHPYKEFPDGLLRLDADARERIRALCVGLNAISVHALMGQTIASDDEQARHQAAEGNKTAIDEAAFLGSRAVIIHCRMARIREPEVRNRVVPILRTLGEYGEDRSVRVCLETPTDLREPAQFEQLIEDVDHDNVGATIDTGHLLASLDEAAKKPDTVAEAYNSMLFDLTREVVAMGKLFHLHLNDIVSATLADHYGIGLGFVDFGRVLRFVNENGYAGMLALEIHRGPGGAVGSITPDEFRDAVHYVLKIVE